MTEAQITLSNGVKLGFAQAATLGRLMDEHDADAMHWHLNDCGCCLTFHTPFGGWVIGPDGDADFHPDVHCGCGR
jgi:hypothetical protein